MNIFTKVTWKTMKQNRVRTLVTIIGVILSTAMFTAVTTFCSSMMDFGKRTYVYRNGSWHISVESADSLLYTRLSKDKDTLTLATAEQSGYAVIGSENSQKPYLCVLGADTAFFEQMPVHLVRGRLPETDTEILLPYHLFTNGGVSAEVGEALALSLGERRMEGEKLGQRHSFYGDEEVFVPLTEKTYTVVGVYERPPFEDYNAPGYTALTYSDREVQADKEYFLAVTLRNPARTISAYEELLESYSGIELNWDVLMFSGVWRYNNFVPFMGGMVLVLCFLILLGSVALIYSAFSISVSERTKQFGLLSSVGATKRQVRRCVFAEAGIVSAVGIPLGLLSGIAGMGVTFALVGDKFRHILSSPYAMRLWLSMPALLAAVLLTLVTVFLSVWVPSRRATKVTAIEAIRQSKEIVAGNRTVKVSKPVYRLFGLEGLLAKKYFRRSRKKYRTTVISLAMSIVLFVSSSVFGSGLSSSVSDGLDPSEVDVLYFSDGTADISELMRAFSKVEGIQTMTYSTVRRTGMVIEEEDLTEGYKEYLKKVPSSLEEGEEGESIEIEYIHYLEDEIYDQLAAQCGIPKEVYESDNPPAVVMNRHLSTVYYRERNGTINRLTYDIAMLKPEVSEITLVNVYAADLEKSSVQIGGKIDEKPFGIGGFHGSYGVLLLYPERARVPEVFDDTRFYFKASDYETMIAGIRQVIKENIWSSDGIHDYVDREKEKRDMVLLAKVFSYGFITLISLISIANVFHTISTNIALRRRDFAMLRSVGMSTRKLLRMLYYECLLYGSKALLYGLPLSVCMAAFIHHITDNIVISVFNLPLIPMGIASLGVFTVVFVTMMYAMNKMKQDNPMDSLKNENI